MHILTYKWNSLTWMLPAVTFSVALAEQAFADHWCWLPGHGRSALWRHYVMHAHKPHGKLMAPFRIEKVAKGIKTQLSLKHSSIFQLRSELAVLLQSKTVKLEVVLNYQDVEKSNFLIFKSLNI